MQLQLTYDRVEDRLLLSLKMGERMLGFWLTRRFTELLWRALWQRAGAAIEQQTNASARELLLAMEQSNQKHKVTVTQTPPLALSAPPILATTLKYGPNEENGHALSLIDASGCGELLMLDDNSLHALIQLLDEIMVTCEWQLDLWRPLSSIAGISPASTALH
ncbi:MAG: hypothetical protein PHQ05_05760 [Sterolibacterium sp.]|nr:hypothetical protein [Sterolibacterium sp.]